jgi:hypothetical protein
MPMDQWFKRTSQAMSQEVRIVNLQKSPVRWWWFVEIRYVRILAGKRLPFPLDSHQTSRLMTLFKLNPAFLIYTLLFHCCGMQPEVLPMQCP